MHKSLCWFSISLIDCSSRNFSCFLIYWFGLSGYIIKSSIVDESSLAGLYCFEVGGW